MLTVTVIVGVQADAAFCLLDKQTEPADGLPACVCANPSGVGEPFDVFPLDVPRVIADRFEDAGSERGEKLSVLAFSRSRSFRLCHYAGGVWS